MKIKGKTKCQRPGFPVDEIGNLDMPFTSKYVINHYLTEGHKNDKIYSGVAIRNTVEFLELEEF